MVTKNKNRSITFTKGDIELLKTIDDTRKNAGFHCLFGEKSYINGRNFTRYDKSALKESESSINKNHNWWISPNTFRTWKRNSRNIRGLNAVWIDADCGHGNNVDKGEFLYDFITQVEFMGNFPKPTAVVDSGSGFHIIYVFDHQVVSNNPCMVRMWSKLERNLVKRFNKLCMKNFGKKLGDMNATDPSRILRVPGSYNLKSSPKKCKVEVFNKNTRPNMFKMVNKYLPTPQYKTRAKRYKHFKKGFHHVTGYKTLHSLKYSRCVDLTTWLNMNHRSIHGYREEFLFIYACNAVCVEGEKSTVIDIKKLNDKLAEPLPESEIRKLKVEMKHIDFREYKITNHDIIEKLDISPKVQKHLIVLINPAEKYRRKKSKRNKISRQKKSKKDVRNEKIAKLHKAGISIRKIAKRLNIGISTVQRNLKKMPTE